MNTQRRICIIAIIVMVAFLIGSCVSSEPLLDTPFPTSITPTLNSTIITVTPTTPASPPTEIPTSTDFLTVTSTPELDFIGFDFESGTQGWGTSEGEYKMAELSATTKIVYEGNSALELNTELFGSGSTEFLARSSEDVYRHTEAVVYLNNNIPVGYDQPGPYDLTGKTFSCFVYLPADLAVEGAPRAYVRLIAKDTKFANQFSQAVDITQGNIDQWIELSFVIDVSSDRDFDSKQTNALGVRLDSLDGSTVQFTGPIYIDNCSIK